MPDRLRFTILGCGSSPGTPRINGDWGSCDPNEPKNKRRRAAMLVERIAHHGGVTTVIIDTGPDFRSQMIDFGSGKLDAVVYTHAHADHIHGLDDLRTFVIDRRDLVDIYADAMTQRRRARTATMQNTPQVPGHEITKSRNQSNSQYPKAFRAFVVSWPD